MPTIVSHPALPFAVGLGLAPQAIRPPLIAAGIVASILPDLDVVAFRLGIPYAAEFGHRGFSHSLFCAALVALLATWGFRRFHCGAWNAFGFLFLSMASHGALDALTNGGQGVALLWPFDQTRYFAPLRIIEVAPLSLDRLFTPRGITVLASEFKWIWLPAGVLCVLLVWLRRRQPSSI